MSALEKTRQLLIRRPLALAAVQQQPVGAPALLFDENKRNNAARVMTRLLCQRLAVKDSAPKLLHHTTYEWDGGIINIRNARVGDHHWTASSLTWAWPLFQAAITGKWLASPKGQEEAEKDEEEGEVDDAPATLEELCKATSLPFDFLQELQEAVLAKQQVVLVGPPGTSKTFIAQQFGRYFVRQRPGQIQGVCHTLYMRANWTGGVQGSDRRVVWRTVMHHTLR
jgi:hypothetical protein